MKPMIFATLLVAATLGASPAPAAKEETVTVPVTSGSISGTLMIPDAKGPMPVALIIAGSGPTDRDGNDAGMMTSNAYKKLAAGLAARGIATLRYDKRDVGASRVNQKITDLRFDDYVTDALALTAKLEGDPRFSSVSIIGHSEGSMIGTIAAERDPRVRAFVSLEGPGRDFATLINEQVRSNPANPPAIVSEVQEYNKQLVAGHTVANPDPLLDMLYRPTIQPFLISEFRYDPGREIAKLKIPVLIVNGTHDIQVSDVDAKRLEQFDPQAKLVEIDGMNHMLVDAPVDRAGNVATYNEPELPLNATMVDDVASFLLQPSR